MHETNSAVNDVNARGQNCPVCGSNRLEWIYEAVDLPVFANVLWPDRDGAIGCPKGDIRLALCRDCGFIFNMAFDPDLLAYGEHYENTLHFSPRFQEYARSLAERLITRYDLHGGDIVEIGCGKGDFLLLLCRLGNNRGTGFDASYEERPDRDTEGLEVRFIKDHFGEKYAPIRADLVCSRQVLEHVPDPRAFLGLIRSAIGEGDDTALFFEVPNALFTIRNTFVWDIIYEHFAYFAPPALAYLFSAGGFDVREISEEFGGQYLAAHVMPHSGALVDGASASEKGRAEGASDDGGAVDNNGAADVGGAAAAAGGRSGEIEHLIRDAAAFREGHRRMIETWRARITREAGGGRAVLWGAGSKGVTFSNLLRLGDTIPFIVDINPRKEGMFIAGSGQRIVPPEFLASYRPDIVVIMNAIYDKEIRGLVGSLGLHPRFISV